VGIVHAMMGNTRQRKDLKSAGVAETAHDKRYD
jgi:hypothetical protein